MRSEEREQTLTVWRGEGNRTFGRAAVICLVRNKRAQGVEQAIDFFGGVVVNDADAEHAALLFDAETLR